MSTERPTLPRAPRTGALSKDSSRSQSPRPGDRSAGPLRPLRPLRPLHGVLGGLDGLQAGRGHHRAVPGLGYGSLEKARMTS